MRFPQELWKDTLESDLAEGLVNALEGHVLVLTDRLANSIYLSQEAEKFFGDSAEALVNRQVFSLMGYGPRESWPKGMLEALEGETGAWRGVATANPLENEKLYFVEASCVVVGNNFICGAIRISVPQEVGK